MLRAWCFVLGASCLKRSAMCLREAPRACALLRAHGGARLSGVNSIISEVNFYERPVRLRLPFRFGAVTLTQAPQIFVRARVTLQDGREGEGASAELLAGSCRQVRAAGSDSPHLLI